MAFETDFIIRTPTGTAGVTLETVFVTDSDHLARTVVLGNAGLVNSTLGFHNRTGPTQPIPVLYQKYELLSI